MPPMWPNEAPTVCERPVRGGVTEISRLVYGLPVIGPCNYRPVITAVITVITAPIFQLPVIGNDRVLIRVLPPLPPPPPTRRRVWRPCAQNLIFKDVTERMAPMEMRATRRRMLAVSCEMQRVTRETE